MRRALLLLCVTSVTACGPRTDPALAPSRPVAAEPAASRAASAEANAALWPARDVTGYDPRQRIRLTSIPAHPWTGDDAGSTHFRDVMEHTSPASRWSSDDASPSTIGHETHHGLLAEREIGGDQAAEFFYFERGFGAYVGAPRQGLRLLRRRADGTRVYTTDAYTNLAHVRTVLPDDAKKLAAGRYETYLLDDDRASYAVLYLFDEWNAYVAGARIAIETHAAGYYDSVTRESVEPDGSRSRITHIGVLDGMIDFLYFSAAGLVALASREPEYLEHNEQLRALFALLAEESLRWLEVGEEIALFRSAHAETLLEHFRTSPENQAIRDFLSDWLGAEWTRRVFGW